MKLPIFLLFVMAFCVSFSSAEIDARFPGFQPVLVPGAPGSSLSAAPGSVVFEDKMVLDTFNVTTKPPVVVVLEVDVPPLISSYGYDFGDSILGLERDIQLTATNGQDGLLFSAGANQGSFNVASPPNAQGYVLVQYDGVDGSPQLSTAVGLGGVDATHRSALGFRILARVDVETEVELRVVDSQGRRGEAQVAVLPGTVARYYYFPFANFDNALDFSSINAIEMQIEADNNVDILIDTFSTYGEVRSNVNCIIGSVLPCETNYYRLQSFSNVQVGDYLSITFDQTNIDDDDEITSNGDLYILSSRFDNLQRELANNNVIRSTLGELPGPAYYNYTCDTDCDVEIVWAQLQNATYYYAVSGRGDEAFEYEICTYYRSVDVYTLFNGVPQTVFYDQRPTYPPSDNALNYRYYTLDIPERTFSENTYLVVNISRVQTSSTPLSLRLMHENLPIDELDTGVIGAVDRNSSNFRMDDLVYPFCVDMTSENRTLYDRPVNTDPRVPCECVAEPLLFGAGPTFQLTCQLVVDPCHFKYGRWYISVELPRRAQPYNALDRTGQANYTLTATTVSPPITVLERNVTVKSWVRPEAYTHFRVDVPSSSLKRGESHLLVHVSNVRNGLVDVFVHQGRGIGANVAGGLETCSPANATCRTGDACNVVIEKCHFSSGSWYVSVAIARDVNDTALINDIDRLPITYTVRADWMEDPEPERLLAGIPVSKYVGEGLYDFYVVDVPPTLDTWLFIELYAKANDTEVIMSVLHGELPGGECYARPDFYCLTGDPRGLRINSGVDTFLTNATIQRESCTYMIQTCELTPGPLYISVYGHHIGYPAYGDNTFYQVPVHYTLWADFDVALSLQNGVSYSETVYENHYQHYYIRADRILQGSYMTVEITNIRHGVPQTLEAYVNYNYLAGECPCYDNLYNCTGNLPCRSGAEFGALPDLDSVERCCTMVVPASDFRPGVWYVAVKGMNEDYFDHTTPIGYTLTVTVHDAPQFTPLILGQPHAGEVPQWNKTLEYANFRLGAEPLPLNDLVFKVTFVQNCEWAGKHDDTQDSIWMYVNRGAPATHYLGGYEHKCQVNTTTQSYCTIVVPHCEWEGDDWFVAIQGQYDADFIGRFTLRASLDPVRDHQMTSGVSYYGRVEEQRYDHYFIDVAAEEDQYLDLVLYTNADQDRVSAFLQKDRRAGDAPCFDHMMVCENQNYCTAQIHACDLKAGRYYFGVYGHAGQFYDTSVEYTITATMKSVTTTLYNGDPFTGHLRNVGDVQHYRFNVPENVAPGSNLIFEVDNVKNGAVTAYVQKGFLAGRCPCFIWEYSCSASMNAFGEIDQEWCQIQVPTCELEAGEYFFSVWAIDQQSPDSNICNTPVGYTLEVNLFAPEIIDPFVAIRRDVSNTEAFELIGNNRYNHYEFSIDDDDWESGYHVIVEITAVQDGALYVYYNQYTPADQNDECHIAELCTGGLGAGTECYWQIPYCLTRPLTGENDKHYITVQGRSGRIQGTYNILIWKQAVPSLVQNDAFTLDTGRVEAPFNAELDIVHDKFHEPHGWTQFVRLEEVPARLDMARGQMLEVFFYRITNNVGEPMSFNVYLHPNEPAGAHECCGTDPAEVGMCQGAPCSHTADTTTSVNNGPDQFTHTCSLGNGYGTDGQDDVLFGERCVVRVWPCEFNKYCANQTTDWFMSVVPLSPTDPVTPGPGLQYSVQWRVRDIRRMEGGAVGSIPLNYALNTYNYSETYSILSETTESEGWLSFYVDFADRVNSRLSIQTDFVVGTGVVYIQGDEFASDTTSCWEYMCTSEDNCVDRNGRFKVNECNAGKYDRYYITVRNTGAVGSNLLVRFRLVETQQPKVIEIPSHPTQARPYVANSGFSIYPDVEGVEQERYDYYMLTVDDDDIDRHQSWIVDVTRPQGDNTGLLQAYIRYEGLPGEEDDDENTCFAYKYSCDLATADDRCLFQIPHCDLIEGHWYISIKNPALNLDEGVPTILPRYTLTTYISNPPNHIPLGQQLSVPSVVDQGVLRHFSFNVSVADLDFIDRESQINFWSQYLRFQLDGLTGSVTAYLNYGDLAGPDNDACYETITQEITCAAGSACYFDVTPCQGLRTGTYYLAVQHNSPATYRVSGVLRSNLYFPLALSQSVTGEGQRRGVVDRLYTRTVTQTELNARGDGNNNYRYLVDVSGEDDDDDDLIDTEYLTFTFSTSSLTGNSESVNYEVFRDDCTRFNCSTTGPSSACTIDAATLAPCSAKGGRYYIRVENPSQVRFTINVAHNETRVQTLPARATLTEIVYPYEYQEYRFRPANVSEGATLSVQICAICGEVEAFIRPDSPAGPSPDNSGSSSSCNIDSCQVAGPDDTTFELDNNCCTLFLDTCIFETRDYYIGVRGVATTYPARNADLSLPARYEIRAVQTNVNITQLSPSCYHTVDYYTPVNRQPQQFAVDIESMNVGAVLRFSMRLPNQVYTGEYQGTLAASVNQTVGYSDECPQTNGVWRCDTTSTCSFTVSSCEMAAHGAGRFYIWADAPRGTEIVVERWDPVVPIIQADVVYHGSINGPSNEVDFDLPFSPNYQIFRIDIDPHVHHDAHFYEKFYAQVRLYNVSQGSVSYYVSSGKSPVLRDDDNCALPIYSETGCSSSFEDECMIELTYDRLLRDAGEHRDIPHTFWITVFGEQQQCELHAIKYQMVVQTNWAITYLPINKTICDSVELGAYNFHRVQPRSVESPQESILRIRVEDVDVSEAVTVYVNNGWLATRDNTAEHGDSVYSDTSSEEGELIADYICGYDDLYLSVAGEQADNEEDRTIDYRLTVEKIPVRVKELYDDSVYHADDDDDDACPHPHDFYRFKITPKDTYAPGSFFRVLVDSEFPTQVYVNKDGFAWNNCADSGSGSNNPDVTGTTSVNVYDFCTFDNTTYFITVVSDGPYYIYTDVRSDVKSLTLGEVHRDELEPGMYQMYTLDICDDWFEADDRLVIEITDADNGDVYGWVRYEANPRDELERDGDELHEEEGCTIPRRHSAQAHFGPRESGYDFLLVNSCELVAGQYRILIRAAPREHTNWKHTTFRLFPYLIDYEIEPRTLRPNTPVYDAVDAYTINRIAPNAIPFAHYYRVHPHHEADGYYEQISHAVVRLSNVTGGLLELRVKCGHLAIAPDAYINGEIYGLTSVSEDDIDFFSNEESYLLDPEMKMQSGRRPFQMQRVMETTPNNYGNECTGCADYCATMSFDDLDMYSTDNSVAIWIPSCYLVWADLYIAVQPAQQYAFDHPIEYNLQMDQYRDFELLQPNHHVQASFENDNWDYDFYYSISAEPESMRWRVVVIDGEGVLVTVRNHRCPLQATWTKQVWCDADYFDRPWMCDIEIPTRAAHPGDNAFFVAVNGKNATYSIAFWRGRENCHAFTGTGRHEGLDFCAGLVPYGTWRWENYTHLDNEAHCFFEDLYEHFRVQPCYTGVTPECNATLQAFACYESFKRCDEQGFYVGTCRDECMGVAYECANNFETVDLEHYNCDSARYLDAHSETCTGGRAFNSLDSHKHFLGSEPDVLLFESSPSQQESQSSATRLSGLFMTFLLVLIASLI